MLLLLFLVFLSVIHVGLLGSSCPSFETIQPCYCTATNEGQTFVICSAIQNSTQLFKVTQSMKSMVIDRFMLFGIFKNSGLELEENEIEEQREALPKEWLSSLRVKELEIQDSVLSSCFLCQDSLEGQSDFLTSLTTTHSKLGGHLCNTCNTKIQSVSTRELQKTPRLKTVDFSFNNIEVIDGYAFPTTLRELKTVILSNNKIEKIHDNAFASLSQLQEIDLSNNLLKKISRKIFRTVDQNLRILDFSWNSIQTLPVDMFHSLTSLREVRFSHNLLEVLPSDTWTRIPALIEKIDLKGNFLVCNCSLSWLSRKISKTTKLVAKCVSPKEVEFQDIKSSLTLLQSC